MGTRSEHAPGTFSWIDLTTSDQEAAKGFYGELFGWEFDDMPVGDTGQVVLDGEDRRRRGRRDLRSAARRPLAAALEQLRHRRERG